ncbi:putative amidohydrolase [Geoglobus ahangari]|uniref:Putative amidohydrolase n=1 Tax=Geoglobus ahangari TaxID=113653 RepID=A0A0F7DBV2_9EURY|nr:carbon-nitrogen hydrolase family protein [Geoglobus ahangari]AKG91736.1 putative amidohydrolase [Geoglobus ahangari]
MRIALYQIEDRGSVGGNIEAARVAIRSVNADFICFPEFFTIPADYKRFGKTVEDAWREISLPTLSMIAEESLFFDGYVIGGSVVERGPDGYYNTCYIFRKGSVVGKYRKISPVEEELEMGIRPRREITVLKTEFGNIGVIICADCLSESVVDRVARKCDVLFLPISLTDPSHPKVEGHPVSERIAREYGVFVVKVSRVARNLGVKSVVMSPEGIVREASSCCREELFVVEI